MSATETSSEAVKKYPNLKPFKKGHDPRRNDGNKKRRRLEKRLKAFDENAWAVLSRMFASEDAALELEALKFWGKYRLACLLEPTPQETSATGAETPKLGPELAAKIAAMRNH